jgi:hypothetical protein
VTYKAPLSIWDAISKSLRMSPIMDTNRSGSRAFMPFGESRAIIG